MSMTPKFKLGDRVITSEKIAGEVAGVHVNTFDDATRNCVMYTLKNFTRPKTGQTLSLHRALRDERNLTLVPEPYNIDFGKPAPVKTAQQVEGEYWDEYPGKGAV